SPFAVPEDDAAPAPRAIGDHFGAREETLAVYLGVPAARAGRAQTGEAPPPGTPGARYAADSMEMADDDDVSSVRPITVARRNLCVLFPGDALDEHDLLPVAELVRTSQLGFGLRDEFVPPCLAIGASDLLMGWIESALKMVITNSDRQASRRSVRGDLADFTPGDFAGFGQLISANAALPLLDHFVRHRNAHPEHVYRVLVSLAGALCSHSPRFSAKNLPHYDHQALGATFKQLHTILTPLLAITDETRWALIPLDRRDSLFVGQIQDPRLFERDASFYLAAAADMEKDRLLRDLPIKVKIASQGQIDKIIELALPGVTPVFTQDPPVAIPRKPNFFYFKLSPAGDAWDGIRGSKTVAIYAPADMPGLNFELVGLRE
ncbi:MAG TPA: type VI secretion system baseplate subunit TssK, partial [Candidatus Eisenbacteria bacterium]